MSRAHPTNRDAQTVLVIDDDAIFRSRLVRACESRGFVVFSAESARLGEERAREHCPEWVILDLRMPGGSGLDLIPRLLEIEPAMRIVVLTGYGSIATALEAVRRGAVNYLTKPAEVDEVLAAFNPDADSPPGPESETPSLARVEWEHIQRVLTDCGGNITKAARKLGIHRRSLQRKLSKHPVSR